MEQLFQLSDEHFDTEELARLFPTGSVTVKKIDEHYYLQIPGWETPLEDGEALEVGKVALSRLNGIALLELGNFRPPKIYGITKRDPVTGNLVTTRSVLVHGVVRSKAHVNFHLMKEVDGKLVEVSKSPTFGETVLSLTDTDEFLERALFLYGTVEHDWRGLYMVLDVVAESYNGPKELLKQDFVAKYKSDIENFKHHANNYRALGVEARHGLAKEKPPKKKMTLAEAQALIQNILSDWVEKLKVRQLIHNLVDFS
jgi:hypothetical protein